MVVNMLTDEELKAIKERNNARKERAGSCADVCLKDRCFTLDVADLLSEVKRLREDSASFQRTIVNLTRERTHISDAQPVWLSPWISVEERASVNDVGVLVYCPAMEETESDFVGIAVRQTDGAYRFDDGYTEASRVTHWMPLPEPPK